GAGTAQVAPRRHRERGAGDRRPRQRAPPRRAALEQLTHAADDAHPPLQTSQARGATVYTRTVAYAAPAIPTASTTMLRAGWLATQEIPRGDATAAPTASAASSSLATTCASETGKS